MICRVDHAKGPKITISASMNEKVLHHQEEENFAYEY